MIHQKCWLTQSALVQSVLDRSADRARIIETGAESYHSQNPGDALEKQNILGSWFYSAGQGKELKAPFLPLQPILAGTEDRTTEQASSVNTGGVKSNCQMQLGHAIRRGPCGGRPRLGRVAAFIAAILRSHEQAPRKHRHRAQRIWGRIGEESSSVGRDGKALCAAIVHSLLGLEPP